MVEGTSDTAPSAVLRALLLTDLVGSTGLTGQLGDAAASRISERHDRLARELLAQHDGLEIDKTDGFLLLFDRPAQAVAYALAYHRALEKLSSEIDVELSARAGIHLGEVILRENPAEDVERGAKPIEAEGLAKPTAARVMALAGGGQTLLSRGAFDLARRAVVGAEQDELEWRAHGAYLFKGIDEPMEIFEVGVPGTAPFVQPSGGAKAQRCVTPEEEATLGWRPAIGLTVPGRDHWVLEGQAGEGGFGEVWIANHKKTTGKRIFKFCFEAERVRGLRREVVLFRLLQQSLGDRDDIAQILDWQFDEAPYFLEAEYSAGGDLRAWAEERGGLAKIPLAERLEIVAQTAVALGAAHSAGVLHKDIKPANVLIHTSDDGSPRARLTDFGIGLVTDRASLSGGGVTVAGFTQTLLASGSSGTTGGTPMYLAPEVLSGLPPTTRSDVFSLGVMLYQTVVGDFSRALAPGWEREIEDELIREDVAACVDGEPDRRLRSADELALRIRELNKRRGEREAERLATRDAERFRRRRRLFAIASVAGVSLTLLVGAFAWRESARATAETTLKEQARRQLYISDMNLASEAWEDADVPRLKSYLEAHRPRPGETDFREFEWYHWWRAAHLHRGRIRHNNLGPYDAMEVSPRSPTVIVKNRVPSSFEFYDPTNLRLVRRIEAPDAVPFSFALSGEDHRLFQATYSSRGIRSWDTDGWYVTNFDLVPESPVEGNPDDPRIVVAATRTGRMLVAGDQAGRVVLWRPAAPTAWPRPSDARAGLVDVGGAVRSLAFSSDGSHVLVGTGPAGTESVSVVDRSSTLQTGRGLVVLATDSVQVVETVESEQTIHAVAASPVGPTFASGDLDGTVTVWQLRGDELERRADLEAGAPVTALAFSPDGHRLAAGTAVKNLVLTWEMTEGFPHLATLRGHTLRVNDVVFVGDRDTLWSAGRDGFVRIWDLTRATPFQTIPMSWAPRQFQDAADEPGSIVAFGSNSAEVWFYDHDQRLVRWDADRAEPDGTLDPRRYLIAAGASDGSAIAGITADGYLRVMDWHGAPLFDDAQVLDPSAPPSPRCLSPACLGGLAVSSGGRTVAWTVGAWKGLARGWDEAEVDNDDVEAAGVEGIYFRESDSGALSYVPGRFKLPSLSPDDRWLSVADIDATFVFDLQEDPPVQRHRLQGWAAESGGAFSPDGTLLAIGSGNRAIRVHDAAGGQLVKTLQGHSGAVTSVGFSPDGDSLLSGSLDGTVRIWDLPTGQTRSTFRAKNQRAVVDVAYAPDGRSIASADVDGTVRVWLSASAEEGEDSLENLLDEGRLDEVLARFPDDPRGFAERGSHLAHLGRPREALENYDRALALGEGSLRLLVRQARALSALGNWPRLTEVASQLIELTDGLDPDFLLIRAHSRSRAGEEQAAREDALRAWKLRSTPYTADLIQRALALEALVSVAQRGPEALDIPVASEAGGRALADGSPAELEWSYTTSPPGDEWATEGFDDSGWQQGPAPFVNHATSSWEPIGTHWGEPHEELWLRHTFELEDVPRGPLHLLSWRHGSEMRFYINGVAAADANPFGRYYGSADVDPRARLHQGQNVLAVHARNPLDGGQLGFGRGVDVGLYRRLEGGDLLETLETEMSLP
jgi:WD40 repeat protein/serine/threonine protein kinase/class 3 adenylate cyclase